MKPQKDFAIIEGIDHTPKLAEEFYDTVENWLTGLLQK